MNLEKLCHQVCLLAKETGLFIEQENKKFSQDKIEVKGLHNFVSYVDKTSEGKIVDGLIKLIPEAGFIAEEGTSTKKGERYNWVIDPLDGTTNFIHGLPPFAISIGLMENEEVILGVIYEVNQKECFYAWKGGKAYLDGKIIHVSQAKKVEDALVATGFPYYDYSKVESFLQTLDYLFFHSHGVRRLGSAATDLAYVACGRFDVFYEYSLNSWDVAAGCIIVKEAGGHITDFGGGNNFIFGKEIIASNSVVHDEFQQLIKKIMIS